jgi:hypothetical protein
MKETLWGSNPQTDFMGVWSSISAILLMLVVVLLSFFLSLGIHKAAIVATVRHVYLIGRCLAQPVPPCLCHREYEI